MSRSDIQRLHDQVERMDPTPTNLSEGLAAACRAMIKFTETIESAVIKIEDANDQLKIFGKKLEDLEYRIDRLEEKP